MSLKNEHKYTARYALIQGVYWPVYCSSYSFVSVFLLSRGFSNATIGVILCLSNIFAVFLQPAVANVADRKNKFSLRVLIVMLSTVSMLLAFGRCLIHGSTYLMGVILVAELTLIFTMQPLINALSVYLKNKGVNVYFGLARGIGSVAFAICSYIVGELIERFGTMASPATSVVLLILIILFVLNLTRGIDKDQPEIKKELKEDIQPELQSDKTAAQSLTKEKKEDQGSIIEFMMTYKRYMLLLFAVALVFTAHFFINNYIFQIIESVGGDAKNMGTAIAVAAAIELPAMVLFEPLLKKIRCDIILRLTLVFFTVKTILTLLAPSVFMVYVAQAFQFASYAFFIPASVYYASRIIRKSDFVKGQAYMTGAITAGGVFSGIAGGWLIDSFGVTIMMIVALVASVIGMLIGLFSIEKVNS
ncbi:MAG: MFS transporter [Clostridia bacterium]|nr:MFS transporter [Clostridia bacterium]